VLEAIRRIKERKGIKGALVKIDLGEIS